MEERKKVYLLSGGLVPLFENRHSLFLDEATQNGLRALEQEYFTEFQRLLHGFDDRDDLGKFLWDVRFIPCTEIEDNLREMVTCKRLENSSTALPLISFDDVYCPDVADGHYSITRLMDPNNLAAGKSLGPRYGMPPLEEQVRKIASKHGNQVDIMDIGVFDGETLTCELKERFEKQGLTIRDAYVMFAGLGGVKNLAECGVNLWFAQAYDWIDWMEIRDMVGLDGRKVTCSKADHIANAFIPYSHNPADWASIPEQFEGGFKTMYHKYFNKASEIMRAGGYKVQLAESSASPVVRELIISE
ncbi:MAG: hypothetical protein ABIE22_01590 [archaeon]